MVSDALSLDLEKQLTFYGSYHHDKVNKIIHMICVPVLLTTGFALVANTGPLLPVPSWLPQLTYLPPNLGTIGAFAFGAVYVLLEPVAGTAVAIFYVIATAWMNYLRAQDVVTTNWVCGILHVLCWVVQFIGHGVYEGRAPALVENIFQAIVLAPLFVWLEELFMFGYRPELQKRVRQAVEKEIARHNAEKTTNGKKVQ